MCWIPIWSGSSEEEPIKPEDKMYKPTIEERLTKLEDELSNLSIWTEAYEDDMDMTVEEIEKRLGLLEKENIDGR